MASEKDFELLDDYVSNRLSGQDKSAFEQKLKADADLNKEYRFQQKIAESLRTTRAAELKNMLNNVPLSSIPKEGTSVAAQVGIWVFVAALVGTGVYFYINKDQASTPPPAITEEVLDSTPEVKSDQPVVDEEDQHAEELSEKTLVTPPDEQTRTVAPKASEKQAQKTEEVATQKPSTLDVFDPSEENAGNDKGVESEKKAAVSRNPSIIVETQLDKKYNFHYQFKESKLFLYGAFEKNLYEIMEFFTDNKRTMFLFYKDNYYLLNEDNEKVKPLSPIQDGELLKKLRDYRGH